MSHALTVAAKEFRTYFKTPVASIFLFFFLLITGLFFFFVPGYFSQGEASLRPFFDLLPWVFLFFAPAVCMKTWAEERKMGTIETLLTMPMTDHAIVLGKFLAALGLIAVALALTFPLPVLVAFTAAGSIDSGPIIGAYFGALLLGATYVAICVFASATTESQIIAFIVGLAICLFLMILGLDPVAGIFPRSLGELMRNLSLSSHFANVQRGVIDTRDVLYYLSLLLFFLLLNVAAVRRRA